MAYLYPNVRYVKKFICLNQKLNLKKTMTYPCDVIGHTYITKICTYEMFVTQCKFCGKYGIYYQAPINENFSNENKME